MGDLLTASSLGTGLTAQKMAVGANSSISCFLFTDGSVKCFGTNTVGQLGQGDTTTRGTAAGTVGDNVPVIDLGTGLTAVDIASTGTTVCAILDNTRVKCWGTGQYGVLGNGSASYIGNEPGEMGDLLSALTL
jgi:alpha-tubulin suppressor-like RCC1 family protein